MVESITDFCRRTQTDTDIQTLLRVGFERGFSNPDGPYNFDRKSCLSVSNRLSSNKMPSGGDRSLKAGLF